MATVIHIIDQNLPIYATGDQNISGVKNFYSRPTVNGTGVLLSGEAINFTLPNTIVYNTGNQNIDGTKSFISNTFFDKDITVTGNIRASGSAFFNDNLNVVNNLNVSGDLNVGGNFTNPTLVLTRGSQLISGSKTFAGNTFFEKDVDITENLRVSGVSTFNSNLNVSGNLTVAGDINNPNLVLTSTDQTIAGTKTFNVAPIFNGNPLITEANLLSYALSSQVVYKTGEQSIAGLKTFSSNAFFTNDVNVTENLRVSGNSFFTGNLSVIGNFTVGGNISNPNLVLTKGKQIISGEKTFADKININAYTGNGYDITNNEFALNIGGNTNDNAGILVDAYGTNPPQILMRRARGIPTGLSGVLKNDVLFNLQARGYVSGLNDYSTNSRAAIRLIAAEDWVGRDGYTGQGTYILFRSTNIGAGTAIDKVIIGSSGLNVLNGNIFISGNPVVNTTSDQTISGSKIFASPIVFSSGTNDGIYLGGSGGSINLRGGDGDPINMVNGSKGGNITMVGSTSNNAPLGAGDINTSAIGEGQGGNILTYGGGEEGAHGGSITTIGGSVSFSTGGSINTSGGDNPGGSINTAGAEYGAGGSINLSNNGGSITAVGGDANAAGSLNMSATDDAPGGSINTSAGAAGGGGSINTSGGEYFGGSINTSDGGGSINTAGDGSNAGLGGSINTSQGGGSIDTSNGGGSINTRGRGFIEFGNIATRTILSGNYPLGDEIGVISITLPNTSGTLALDSTIANTGSILNNKINSLSGISVLTFGNQTISGRKTFFDSGVFSNGGTPAVPLLNNPLSIVGSGNNYLQLNIQNRASGRFASADLVITANNGTDNTNYINLGINNSGYSDPEFTNGSGLDGYLYIDGGNLDIGTKTPGKIIEFHAGGVAQNSTIARIDSSGINILSGTYRINDIPSNTFTITLTHSSATPSVGLNYFGMNDIGYSQASLGSRRRMPIAETCQIRKASWSHFVGTLGNPNDLLSTGYVINTSSTPPQIGIVSTVISSASDTAPAHYITNFSPPINVTSGDLIVAALGISGFTTAPVSVRDTVILYCYN